MARKEDNGITFKIFIIELGAHYCLTIYGPKYHDAPGIDFMKSFQRNNIKVTRIEQENPNQKPSEGVIHGGR